jgi:photosystem II stability/assembly factor-like uncharacterized protein
VERARSIALELCDALTRAHHLQIIHRDLKPENVLLAADGTPKLSDFGVARLVSEANRITNTGTQVGTPFYMAPEAWEGSQLDAQADIWALGVVLFEMLTGQVPFGGDTLIAVMNKVLNAPLPDLCQLRSEVPPGLAQVVAGMLTRDKAQRYTTMRVVAADLERGEPVAPASAAASLSATHAATPVATQVAQSRRRAAWPIWAGVVGGFVVLAGLAVGAIFTVPRLLATLALAPTPAVAAAPQPTVEPAPGQETVTPQPTKAPEPTQGPAATPLAGSSAAAGADLTNGQWQRVAGGHLFPSATINTLAVDPRDSEHVLAGTYGSGIYLSSDGGQTWTPANTGLGAGLVASLAIDPQDPNIVYAGMAYQGGVYKSTDGGQTWQSVNTGIDLNNAWNWTGVVAVDANDPRRVYYTGAYNGLWLSTDAGASWTLQGPPKQDCVHITGLAIDPADPQHLYAASSGNAQPGCPSGIYDSADGGRTWQHLSADAMTGEPGANWTLAVDPADFKRLYAGGDTGTWKSTDGGQQWDRVSPKGCDYLALNPGDGAVYCTAGKELSVSRDSGQTWQSAPAVALGGSFERHPLAFAPSDPKTMYTGYDKLLRSADNGASWQTRGNFGVRRAQLTVDPHDGNRLYLISGERDQGGGSLYLSTDGGKSWQSKLTDVSTGRLAIDGPANVVYYASVASKDAKPFYRSLDNGTTWTGFGSGDLGKIWQLLPTPLNSTRLWAMPECGSAPLLSEDNGQTFKEVAGFPSSICMPILASSSKGERLYIATWGDFLRSVDNGQTWSKAMGPGGIVNTVVVDPLDPNVVYLGTTHLGVRKTTDGGDTWQPAGLPSAAVNEIAIDPQTPQTLYAASDEGAFISLDGGAQWQPLARGLGPNPIVYSIAVDPNDPHRVFAATADGVFQLNIAAAGHDVSPGAQARAFAEPILSAIAARPPDFADDFSMSTQSASQWSLQQAVVQSGTLWLQTVADSPKIHARDFALEFDARAHGDNRTNFTLQFHQTYHSESDESDYNLQLNPAQGRWTAQLGRGPYGKWTEFDSGQSNQIGLEKWMHLLLVARGEEYAIYLGGSPLTYFRDSTNQSPANKLVGDKRAMNIEIDNFKFWDLANVPGLAISPGALTTAAAATPGGFSRVEFNVAKGAECNPGSVPAGLVVFHYGVGGGSKDLATTLQAIGADTYGTIVANGQVVPPANTDQAGHPVDAHGRTLAPNKDEVGNFSFETFAAAQLQPGPYEMRAAWNRADGNSDPRSCTLTVRP